MGETAQTCAGEILNVPEDVVAAALLLVRYFQELGIVRWELGGVCSRDHAIELYQYGNVVEALRRELGEFDDSNNKETGTWESK